MNLGNEIIKQRQAWVDVSIEEHEDFLGCAQRTMPAGVRLSEPPIRWRGWGEHVDVERPRDAGGCVS